MTVRLAELLNAFSVSTGIMNRTKLRNKFLLNRAEVDSVRLQNKQITEFYHYDKP